MYLVMVHKIIVLKKKHLHIRLFCMRILYMCLLKRTNVMQK